MATSPNFSWPEPDNTDLVKNGALAIRTAVDAIDASMVDLKGGTTGQVLSKTSNTDMDFTWVAQDDSNAIQNAIVDAKGDLIGATAADTPARLAVGANGTVLTADSAEATGLKWATPAAGGMTLLSTTSLSGASVTVSSISQSYVSLYIVITGVTNATADGTFEVQPNGSTNICTGPYIFNYNNSTNSGATAINADSLRTHNVSVDRTDSNNAFILTIHNYTSATIMKPVNTIYQWETNSANPKAGVSHSAGIWTTSAITSIKVLNTGGNLSTGTMLIYGVK